MSGPESPHREKDGGASPSSAEETGSKTAPAPGKQALGGGRDGAIPLGQAILRDITAFVLGTVIWAFVLRLPWMTEILERGPFLLYPLIPLVIVVSGILSMIAVRYRFLVADLAWVVGLLIASGLPPQLRGPEVWVGIRVLAYTGAWFGLIYAPLILLGIWAVDRLRGIEA